MAYPKINSVGQLFVEDFDSIQGVVDNGGTIVNSISISDGVATFSNSGYIESCASPQVDRGTLMARFKLASNDDKNMIIGTQVTSPTTKRCYLGVNDSGNLGAGIGGESWNDIEGSSLSTGVWYTAAVTWDGTTVRLVLDGVEDYNDNQTGVVNSGFAYIGANNLNGAPDSEFNGEIDWVKVFDRALSDAEINDIIEQDTFQEVDESQFLVNLDFRTRYDDGSNIVTDNKGSLGGTFILGDGSTASSFPTQLTPKGYEFDGANQYIKAGNILNFDNDEAQSIAFLGRGLVGGAQPTGLLSKSLGSGGGYSGYQIFLLDNDIVFRYYNDGVNSGIRSTTTNPVLSEFDVVHCVITYDGSGTEDGITIYTQGELADKTDSGNSGFSGSTTNSADYTIGDFSYGGTPMLEGDLFMFRHADFVLTPAQVKWLYQKDINLINQ